MKYLLICLLPLLFIGCGCSSNNVTQEQWSQAEQLCEFSGGVFDVSVYHTKHGYQMEAVCNNGYTISRKYKR